MNSTEEQFQEIWRKTFAPENQLLDVNVKFYDNLISMQMALNAKEIHEIVLPDFSARYLMNQDSSYESLLVLKSNGTGLAFGFNNDNQELCDVFNNALRTLRNNWKLAAIEGMYIASPGKTEPSPVKFSHFDNAKTIRVAVTGDLPPIDIINADGTPAGFNTAVLAEIGNIAGINIELVNIEAGARTAALASGRVDVVFWYEVDLSGGVQTDKPDGVILSEPYYEWDKFIHLKHKDKKSEASSTWDIKRGIIDLFMW